MKFPKIPARPAPLIDFFEEGLAALGAVCERPWHDRMEVLAEGDAARLWHADGALFAGEVHFPASSSSGGRDAATEVFAGCPLTFHLVEALWARHAGSFRACLSDGLSPKPPEMAVALKLWQAQFGPCARWQAAPMRRAWHLSAVAPVRCEVQAIDQSWTFHRLAFALSSGERDAALESAMDHFTPCEGFDAAPAWPEIDREWLAARVNSALTAELAPDLDAIKRRQEHYLRRELARVDGYFEHYAQELEARRQRQRKEETVVRYGQRIEAARAEHQRRRADQIERHAIRVMPRVDGLLLLAEPAFATRVEWRAGHEHHSAGAVFLPRARRWFCDPPAGGR